MSPAQRRLHRILDGDAAAQGGETDEARRKYDQAGATIRPWDRRSEVRRAAVLFTAEDFVRRKEYATATEVLEQRLLAQPSERLDTRCLLTLGLAHAGCGYAQKADVLLRRALAIDPRGADAPRVLLGLADTRRTAGDAEAAKAHEEALLERFPYSEEAALIHARRKGIQTRNGTALR